MKKLCLCLGAVCAFFFSSAQDSTKVKELGLSVKKDFEFGFLYKVGKENALWRISAISSGGRVSKNSSGNNVNSIGIGFKAGREFRKPVTKNFELRYGVDLSYAYLNTYNVVSTSEGDKETKRIAYSPGVEFVLGANYVWKDRVVLGAELNPFIKYDITETTNINNGASSTSEGASASYGMNSGNVLLSLSYRF